MWALHTAGLMDRFSGLVAANRSFTLAMGFAAAIAFPFTRPTTTTPTSASTS